MHTLCMYPNVTPDSPSNFCPQRIHISPNEPGCVQSSVFTATSATTTKKGEKEFKLINFLCQNDSCK